VVGRCEKARPQTLAESLNERNGPGGALRHLPLVCAPILKR
jgi:hypothetical protein